MFERIKRLYTQGKLTDTGVKNAVLKGWITNLEYEEITGTPYSNKR